MPAGGIALLCDAQGILVRVLRDELGIAEHIRPGQPFTVVIDQDSLLKALAFMAALRAHQAVFDWELNVTVGDRPFALQFTGGATGDDRWLIVGATSHTEAARFYDELLAVSNEQANALRTAAKHQARLADARSGGDSVLYDELTRVNNELATAQRHLAKQNHELERLNKEKNVLLGMAAHDLRNPLGAIVTYCGILLDEAGPTLRAEHVEFLDLIKSSGEFMLGLVNDLLDVAKIEAGKLELALADVDLTALVRRQVNLNRHLAQHKRIALNFDEAAEPIRVRLDAGKIQQVLTNLLTNAIKFSPFDTMITVEVRRERDTVVLGVRDQGPGILPHERVRLFKPFQRASVQATAGESSTGLGLAIARRIIEGHGGRIWVESEVGHGSTFLVALPIEGPGSAAS